MRRFRLDLADRSQRSNARRAHIERIALDAGASAVRFASARADAGTQERLQASFERGDLATWPYDERYARSAADPQTLLPDARSVVCVAVRYDTPPPNRGPLEGRVSNYAWSHDYHRAMRSLLQRVADEIAALDPQARTALACDTKPLAERALAQRSGLGWVGKHTNVISPQLGSFVFLGEVVTTLDLQPDAPLKKTCGACTRCISACPTGALRGDYTIDATRCIADLTQRTDAIPRDLRPYIGTWVWGCDICQDVCPPTQRARRNNASDERFEAVASLAAPDLMALLQLKSGRFKREFATSAMGWRGAAVLRRNAAVALGNSLDRSAVAPLAQALREDPHPLVRGHAAWALGRIGAPAAIEALRACAASEAEAGVRSEIDAALEPFVSRRPLHQT